MIISKLTQKLSRLGTKRQGFIGVAILTIAAILIWQLSPAVEAAVTVDTSTTSAATQSSFQRKTWHDGTRYWSAFFSGTAIEFWYSTNGTSWTQNTSATISVATADFSIEADSSNAFITYTNGIDVEARKATSYPGTGFAWGSATIVFDGDLGECATYSLPIIKRDTNNKVRINIEKQLGNPNCTVSDFVSVLSTTANDITAFGSQEGIDSITDNSSKYGTVAALAGGDMYAVWKNNTSIRGKKNTAGTWDTNPTPIATGVTGLEHNVQMVSNTTADEAYLTYINSSNQTVFQKYVDGGLAANKIDDAGNPGAMPGAGRQVVRTSTGTLYALVNDGGSCEIWKSSDGSSWTEQDSADNPACHATDLHTALAIDSTNKLHIAYVDDISTDISKYITFTASDDQFGTEETAIDEVANLNNRSMSLAIDSNDKPHFVETFSNGLNISYMEYNNRTTGAWGAVVTIDFGGNNDMFPVADITISEDNIPEISYIDSLNDDLTAAVGNQNDATSFTLQDVDTTINDVAGERGTSIGIDSSGNTWIAYVDENGASDFITLVKHNDADAWTTWQTPVTNSNIGKEPSLAAIGDNLHILYQDANADIATISYVGTTWGSPNVLQTGTYQDVKVRWANYANNGSNKPLDYLFSDGTDLYYSNVGVWQPPVILDSNSGNDYPTISINTTSNDLYVIWIRANVVYYKKGATPYASANWDAAATTLYNTGTNAWLSGTYQGGGCGASVIWTEGTGSPWNVKYESVNNNCPPAAPTLSTPTADATDVSAAPQFQLRTTDIENDYLRYKIEVCSTSNCSAIVRTIDQTGSQTGWSGQDQQGNTAYTGNSVITSSTMAIHNYQMPPLAANTQYWWRAYAIDPAGKNTFSPASSIRSFTTGNDAPAAPTQLRPLPDGDGELTQPRFELKSTDLNSDYLRYKIEVCSTSNCSALVRTIDQTGSQTGWSGQDQQSGTAYTGNYDINASTTASHFYQTPPLSSNTVYWWRAYAIDPGGRNTWSSASAIQSFATGTTDVQLKGNINIKGDARFKP